MTQINLLPWREEKRKKLQIRFGIAAAISAILAIFFIICWHIYYDDLINHQQQRNQFLQDTLQQEGTKLMGLNKKDKQQVIISNELNFLINLRKQSYQAVELLNELPKVVPDSIQLEIVIRKGNKIFIGGRSQSNPPITLLMENMAKSTIFNQPVLTRIIGQENKEGEDRHFQLQVEQRN